VIGAITGSAYVLVFAVLSPVIAVASMLDARRSARRLARADAARFDEECRAYERLVEESQREERAERDSRVPTRGMAHVTASGTPEVVRVGVARQLSSRAPDVPVSVPTARVADRERSHALLERARWHPALPVVVPRGALEVRGSGPAAHAMRERLLLEVGVSVLPSHDAAAQRPPEEPCTVIEVTSVSRMSVARPGAATVQGRPDLWSALERDRHLLALDQHSEHLPERVAWRELASLDAVGSGIPLGRDEAGTFVIDPCADGPHLLVGGTTGSGKSEFLRTLVLGWAHRSSPAELALLFVDFKGGASFLDLDTLPHALEVITDLDEATAARALSSLRAEIRRRERWLRDRGARDVRDSTAGLGRLVIVIDEYAALLASLPDLHGVIIDCAARGRSLGIHLVLCTQHPTSAVRDAIAANCAIRVSFRITDDADAAFLGAGLAPRLRALPRGRALVSDAQGLHEVQTALIDDTSIAAVRHRWRSVPGGASPWVPPLPEQVTLADLERQADLGRQAGLEGQAEREEPASRHTVPEADAAPAGWVFGLEDRPERQQRALARWIPRRDGPLAVLGSAGSGRTGALAAVADAATRGGCPVTVLDDDWADAMATVRALATGQPGRMLLVADDFDALVRRAGDDRVEFLRLWDDASSAVGNAGGSVAVALAPAQAQYAIIEGRFTSTLELRGARPAAGPTAARTSDVDDRPQPGRGYWQGAVVQVVMAPALPSPTRPPITTVHLDTARPLVVIARQPRRIAEALARAHPDAVVLSASEAAAQPPGGGTVALEPRVLMGDVEAWTTQWSALQTLRRTCRILLIGVDAPDVRSLLGIREQPPPLGTRVPELWLVDPEEPVVRARWALLEPSTST